MVSERRASIDLYWLPLGAGGWFVRTSGRMTTTGRSLASEQSLNERRVPTRTSPQSLRGADTMKAIARSGAVFAVVGTSVLLASTMLHPTHADPSDAPAAFAEYAADSLWVWSHLGQFAGIALLSVALVTVVSTLEPGRASTWGRAAVVGTAASLAVAAVLEAVDGVALKAMVDRWATATGDEQRVAFEAALAVRHIEVGLASLLSISFGSTVVLYGLALLRSSLYPMWLAVVSLPAGLGTISGGLAQSTTGFSPLAMTISMSASSLLLIWMISIAVHMWRLAPRLERTDEGSSS
jgi:hypothetical protein